MRKPEGVTDDENTAFRRMLPKDVEDYMSVKHFSIEDQLQFPSNTVRFPACS